MPECETVLVIGAGVDKTPGINFPLAADLLPAINIYLTRNEEGKAINQLLRQKIDGLRFRFDRFINSAINDIVQREPGQLKETIQRVQRVVQKLPENETNLILKKQGDLIIRLFEKLQQIASANLIDDETRRLIEDVFGERLSEFDLDDHIVDIRTLSVSDTFKSILRYTLRQSLEPGANLIAHALGADLLDIEKLLIEKFLGFYNNKLSDIKNYVYISWCLWSYLMQLDKDVRNSTSELPFYSEIPQNWKGITLNYTSFLETQLRSSNVIYFHGGLSTYVRMDNRELLTFDSYKEKSPRELLESHICDNWFFDEDTPSKSKCLIPSLVPPMRLKPILSKEYIDLWYHASEWLRKADHIVIIGYSFNTADEHFNDLLRSLQGKKITIIGPNVLSDFYMERISSVWGVSGGQFTQTKFQNKNAKKLNKMVTVQAPT